MFKVSFSDCIGVAGIILGILLVVLDKAGKLKGGWLYGLLIVAGIMTLFIAIGNDWVTAAPEKWRLWRAALMLCAVGLVYSGAAIWIAPSETTASEKDSTAKSESPSFLFVFGAPLGDNDSPVWMMMLRHYGPGTAYNCDIEFVDDDRKNLEHDWLLKHPGTSFLPPGGVVGQSQVSLHVPEIGSEATSQMFEWNPVDPNSQHYTVSISCRDGVFVEHWEITRVNGVLRTKITIEHGPEWVRKNPTLNPIVLTCTDQDFISTELASVIPVTPPKAVNRGWQPNHRYDFPVAIIDQNNNLQVLNGFRLSDGSQRTDLGCWNLLTKHFGDASGN
jgi:hypothetical protein